MRDLERAESEMRPTLHNNGGDDDSTRRSGGDQAAPIVGQILRSCRSDLRSTSYYGNAVELTPLLLTSRQHAAC